MPTLIIIHRVPELWATLFETAPLGLNFSWTDIQASASDFASIPLVTSVVTAVIGISLVTFLIGKLYDLFGGNS